MSVKEDTNRLDCTGTVSYETNGLVYKNMAGTTTGCYATYTDNQWFWSSYPYYYPVQIKSSIEQSFKIVSKLMEKKVIPRMTLKQFIETVNAVAEIL
ncbi:MAG: hypothetical protein WC479_05865 [Candidatus Izemoplasmatales bacterium]